MRKKVKNNKGFTLAELLIVVAIIAVLVAVSIPIFTAQLEKAREATDIANFRAAKAAFIVAVLDGTITADKADRPFYYHADTGLVDEKKPENPYGEGTKANPFNTHEGLDVYPRPYEAAGDYTSAFISATYKKKLKGDALEINWEGATVFTDTGAQSAPGISLFLDEPISKMSGPTDTETNTTYP